MVTGQADAAIIDEPVAVDAVEKTGGIEIATTIPTNELYGIAISKDNPELLDAVNGALQEMKDDGTIQGLYDKYWAATRRPTRCSTGPRRTRGRAQKIRT